MSNDTGGNWGWMPGGGGNRKKKRWKKEVCFLFLLCEFPVRAGSLVLGHCQKGNHHTALLLIKPCFIVASSLPPSSGKLEISPVLIRPGASPANLPSGTSRGSPQGSLPLSTTPGLLCHGKLKQI